MEHRINTILFDLDGTLLPMDTDLFMKIYFDEMAKVFENLIEKDQLIKSVWTATGAMVKNTEKRTNEDVFMEVFKGLITGDLTEYQAIFDRFYDTEFQKVRAAVETNEYVIKSVALLLEKGYQLVVATNPLFPRKAILHRIHWAGLNPEVFSYITSYEQNHYCKPQVHYYNEILEAIEKHPEECMMIGNDVQEDMVAGQVGMKTFLVETHMLNRSEDPIPCDYKGDYKDLYEFVQQLPNIK